MEQAPKTSLSCSCCSGTRSAAKQTAAERITLARSDGAPSQTGAAGGELASADTASGCFEAKTEFTSTVHCVASTMADLGCSSGCCGTAKPTVIAATEPASSCCSPTEQNEPGCARTAAARRGKVEDCRTTPMSKASIQTTEPRDKPLGSLPAAEGCISGCCSPSERTPSEQNQTPQADERLIEDRGCPRKDCCSATPVPGTGWSRNEVYGNTSHSSGCVKCDRAGDDGKTPCCDASCILRIAARECSQACPESGASRSGSESESDSIDQLQKPEPGFDPKKKQKKPCIRHVQDAQSRYGHILEALGCICRALASLNLESCCLSGGRDEAVRSPSRRSGSGSSSSSSLCKVAREHKDKGKLVSASCQVGCCSSAAATKRDIVAGVSKSQTPLGSISKGSCSAGCCNKEEKALPSDPTPVGCGAGEECCSGRPAKKPAKTPASLAKGAGVPATPTEKDLEKGHAAAVTPERVILSIQGMTCTGCETKLSRTLAAMPGVSGIKASLVMARAEFDVDGSAGPLTAEEAIAQLKRATGFECTRVWRGGHELIVLTEDLDPALLDGSRLLPAGVTEMVRVDKTPCCRVVYDADVIGARDLVEGGALRQQGGGGGPGDSTLRHVRLAPVAPGDPGLAAGRRHVRYLGLMTLLSAALTVPVLVLAWAPLPHKEEKEVLYGSISLALATVIQVVVAGPFYPAALKALVFARVIEMDLLIVLSTSAAYVFSVVAFGSLVRGSPLPTGEFFETSTLLVTLIMLGRLVSAAARQRAVESISIRSVQQTTALLLIRGGEGGGRQGGCSVMTTREIDARLLQHGDVFRVLPDSRVVTDGSVVSGTSELDESVMTGESRPVAKEPGSAVVAGSVNGWGTLDVRLTLLPGDNTISTIANMVDEAKLSKPRVQDVADRVAGYFVPVVCALTVVTFVSWLGVGTARDGMAVSDAAVQAVTYAIAVLIISCPCAIGLAVPMVMVIAGGVAADHGVVFKTAETIELAKDATHVVFDKTGTLTRGELTVQREAYPGRNADGAVAAENDLSCELGSSQGGQIASLVLGLVSGNKHPVSSAVASHLTAQGVRPSRFPSAKTVPGKGVQGTARGKAVRAGNAGWLGLTEVPIVREYLEAQLTVFCVMVDSRLEAVFGLQDTLRPEASRVVSALQMRGVEVSIVSGDDNGAVRDVAARLGIPPEMARSRASPADKQLHIQALLGAGGRGPGETRTAMWTELLRRRRRPVVIFVGDGTNDAAALAAASIGVHMSSSSSPTGSATAVGSEVARGAADAVLTRPDLGGVLVLLALSRAAMRRVAFNFAWSFAYNVFAVLLAGGAFMGVGGGGGGLQARIPPAYAGLGEIVSVVPVVVVAVMLRWARLG